jgi:hypothetical protein
MCNTHRHRDRRHGDPLQEPIRVRDIRPYLRSLDKQQKVRPDAPAWALLRDRWDTLIGTERDTLRSHAAGLPGNRWERGAAQELVRVAEQASAEDAWRTAVAMFLLREHEPRRFATDRAFLVQLGRRVRHLAEANQGSFYNPATGRTKHVYRDPNPRVAAIVGQRLAEMFGAAGVYFAEREQREAERKQTERRAFFAALRDVAEGDAA